METLETSPNGPPERAPLPAPEHRPERAERAEGQARDPDPPPLPEPGTPPLAVSTESIAREHIHEDAMRVISRLSRYGHEAYLVGGCVRDLLLGRAPKDFDVATSAHPREIRNLFRNARIIGRRFKLAHILYGGHVIETATFRTKPQQEEEDGDLLIREDNAFGTAEQDARRRDFTINGLFLDPIRERILDYVGGLTDLEAGVLRTIGDPRVRIPEDPVRILRAIKFATRLGFRIDDQTWEAMCANAPSLQRSAPPRVFEEILRLMTSGTSLGAFRMMRACGALRAILPAVDAFLGARDDPDPSAHDRADTYWRLLEALDADIHAGRIPSRALCLAVIFQRLVERRSKVSGGRPGEQAAELHDLTEELLEPVAREARLARREIGMARRMIADQPRFAGGGAKGPRATLFLLGEGFEESLALFRLRMAAWGQGWDVYQGWLASYQLARGTPPEELARLVGRRRRRRGRRRGSGGASGSAGPRGPGGPDSSEDSELEP